MKTPKVKIREDNYHLFIALIASLLRKRIRSFFIVILRWLFKNDSISFLYRYKKKRHCEVRSNLYIDRTGH